MSGMADWQAKISIDIEDLKKRIKVAEGELDKVTKEDVSLLLLCMAVRSAETSF